MIDEEILERELKLILDVVINCNTKTLEAEKFYSLIRINVKILWYLLVHLL